MDYDKIGTPGEIINSSQASASAHIEPDLNRMKQYDLEYSPNLYKKTGTLGAVLLSGGLLLLKNGKTSFGVILLVIAILTLLLAKLFKTANDNHPPMYKRGALTAGMVTDDPEYALAITSLSYQSGNDSVLAVKKVKIGLGDWSREAGTRLAFSTGFGRINEAHQIYVACCPLLLNWATDDEKALELCVNACDEEDWETLTKLLPEAKQLEVESLYILAPTSRGYASTLLDDYLKQLED